MPPRAWGSHKVSPCWAFHPSSQEKSVWLLPAPREAGLVAIPRLGRTGSQYQGPSLPETVKMPNSEVGHAVC